MAEFFLIGSKPFRIDTRKGRSVYQSSAAKTFIFDVLSTTFVYQSRGNFCRVCINLTTGRNGLHRTHVVAVQPAACIRRNNASDAIAIRYQWDIRHGCSSGFPSSKIHIVCTEWFPSVLPLFTRPEVRMSPRTKSENGEAQEVSPHLTEPSYAPLPLPADGISCWVQLGRKGYCQE